MKSILITLWLIWNGVIFAIGSVELYNAERTLAALIVLLCSVACGVTLVVMTREDV